MDVTVYTQVLPPVVSFLRTHLTCVKLQVLRWRLYMVLDPMSMGARGCGPFEGLLHTPSAATQKKKVLRWQNGQESDVEDFFICLFNHGSTHVVSKEGCTMKAVAWPASNTDFFKHIVMGAVSVLLSDYMYTPCQVQL